MPVIPGAGITSKLMYCDVLTSRDPKEGIIIKLPRRGVLTLRFNCTTATPTRRSRCGWKRAFALHGVDWRVDPGQHVTDACGGGE